MGDGHAAMGDGEVAGTAIEVPLHARLQVDVIKGQKINWPRFENDQAIMTVGAYRPLDDCVRIAFTELVAGIHSDYGLSVLGTFLGVLYLGCRLIPLRHMRWPVPLALSIKLIVPVTRREIIETNTD